MKKNFKKSKFVIVPALASLLLTGVASVTGTVAWFTASRKVESVIDSFNTVQVTSSLDYAYIADSKSGTSLGKNGEKPDAHKLVVNGALTHGSYDAKYDLSGNLYVANLNDDGKVTSYDNLKSVATEGQNSHVEYETVEGTETSTQTVKKNYWLAKAAEANDPESKDTWYGVSWKMTFTGASKVDGKTNYLLLDAASCEFENKNNLGDTIKGLRIALMTNSKVLVIGGDEITTHVDSTTTKESVTLPTFDANTTYFDVSNADKKNVLKVDDGDTKLTDNTYKWNFGEIGTNGLTITCVAWFEGTDENVKSEMNVGDASKRDVNLSDVKTTLSFYSRTK